MADILPTRRDYARARKTAGLTAAVGANLEANINGHLLQTSSVDGKVFGINPVMVWFNPKAWTGPTATQDWAEIAKWTEAKAAKVVPVWWAARTPARARASPASASSTQSS